MVTSGRNPSDPPMLFFWVLIAYGIALILGGLLRWPYFLESPRLQCLFKLLFERSTEEQNEYAAAFCVVGGTIAVVTGVLVLFLL